MHLSLLLTSLHTNQIQARPLRERSCGIFLSFPPVEINEDQPTENKQRLFILELAIARKSAPFTWYFGKDFKADRGVGKLYTGKKKGFRCVLIGSCCHGEAVRS